MSANTRESATEESIDVLLVEDNPGDVRLTQEAFDGTAADVALHVATDGDEALTFLRRRTEAAAPLPDLVLLDLNLPKVGGLELLEAVRDDPSLTHLPILVLTSSKAHEDVRESYERAANAYLTKPISPDEFDSLVTAVEEFWFEQVTLPPAPCDRSGSEPGDG